jgi:hypothetical protein
MGLALEAGEEAPYIGLPPQGRAVKADELITMLRSVAGEVRPAT